MELHARDLAPLHDRAEWLTVFRDGDGIRRDRRDEAVRKVHLRAGRHAVDDRRVALQRDGVPSDVRNLDRWRLGRSLCATVFCAALEPIAAAGQDAETRAAGRLLAPFEEPLHAETDAE